MTECPNCRLLNAAGAVRCDCGYDFRERKIADPPPKALRAARRMSRLRALSFGCLGWALLAGVGMYRGCSSAALPPEPSPAELARVRATHFRASVGVEKYRYPVYSERLVSSLRRTGLFDAVDTLERLPRAPLVARVERGVHGTAAIPIWTALTLGIVPTIVKEEWGEVFSLRPNGAEAPAVGVNFTYAGPSTLGFAAAIMSLSPDITTTHPPETVRFRNALSAAVCSKAGEIEGLLRAE